MEKQDGKKENSLIEGIKVGTMTSVAAAMAWVGLAVANNYFDLSIPVPAHTTYDAAAVAAGIGILAGTAKAVHHHVTHASHEGKVVEEKAVAASAQR